MQWHLLSQHFVSLEPINLRISVLEVVLSQELQLAQVLVSGLVSYKTMTSLPHGPTCFNLEIVKNQQGVLM